MNGVYDHATDFSRDGYKWHLNALARDFHKVLDTVADAPADQLIISEENLMGQMPGKNDVFSYAAVPPLLDCVLKTLRDHFGEQTEIDVIFSTRNTESWMSSIWKHTLTVKRLTDAEETLKDRLRPHRNLAGIVQDLQQMFPGTSLTSVALEDTQGTEFGPATPLLDWIELPEEQRREMKKTGLRNPAGQTEIYAQLLELNRSSLKMPEFRAAREPLLEELKQHRRAVMASSQAAAEKTPDY